MIVVTVELHSAITHSIECLGQMVIANDGTGDADHGNYNVWVGRKGQRIRDILRGKRLRVGRVERYPRQRYNVWRLVLRALRDAFPEEKT